MMVSSMGKWFSPFFGVMIVFFLLGIMGICAGLDLMVVPVEALMMFSWSATWGYIVGGLFCLGFGFVDVFESVMEKV